MKYSLLPNDNQNPGPMTMLYRFLRYNVEEALILFGTGIVFTFNLIEKLPFLLTTVISCAILIISFLLCY